MDGNSEDFRDVIATIFLFLKNNNFNESADVLRNECKDRNILLNNISGQVLYECKESIQKNISATDRRITMYTFLRNVEEKVKKCEIPNNDKRNQFKQLEQDYKNLLDVTIQLTKLLQTNLEEQAKNVHLVLTQCEFLHPTLFQPIIKRRLSVSTQTIRSLDSSQTVEHTTTDNQEKITGVNTSVSISPLNIIQNEVKHVLENVVNNVLILESDRMQRNVENNIQDIKILLEDIIQEILLSLDEKQPPREKSFQVLPNKTDTATILDKTDCGNSEKINLIDRDSIFRKKSKFEVKQPIKRKGASKTGVSKGKHFPKTPLCYLEICRKNQDDPSLPCKCMKCLPEQNRYYCSCYDLICKDIDEEIIGITTFKNTRTQENITNDLKETQNGTDICKICDAQKCSCAFQSRPKIGRSPPV